MNAPSARGILEYGLSSGNVGLVQLLGLCRLLAVSNNAVNALGHADLARAAHRRCRQVLADHLGVDPTSETEAVAAAIDAGMPADELVRAFLDRSLHGLLAAA